jgi:hypothetical protein
MEAFEAAQKLKHQWRSARQAVRLLEGSRPRQGQMSQRAICNVLYVQYGPVHTVCKMK